MLHDYEICYLKSNTFLEKVIDVLISLLVCGWFKEKLCLVWDVSYLYLLIGLLCQKKDFLDDFCFLHPYSKGEKAKNTLAL